MNSISFSRKWPACVAIVGLDVADAAVIILELTLNDKVRVIGSRQIKVIVAGDLAIERDLKVLVAGLPDRNVLGVELQWGARFSAYHSIPTRLQLPEGPREGNGCECIGCPLVLLEPSLLLKNSGVPR